MLYQHHFSTQSSGFAGASPAASKRHKLAPPRFVKRVPSIYTALALASRTSFPQPGPAKARWS
jgi:hypothetical protein